MTKLILDPLGNSPVTITEADLIDYQISKVHTGVGSLEATVAGRFDEIRPFVQRKARFDVEINGSVEFNGFVIRAAENKETGEVRLQGAGIANRLEETRPDYENRGGSVTFSDIALEDAIEDYWTLSPFFSGNVTVHPEPTETVATDATVQTADPNTEFNDILSISDTDPFIVQNGELQLAQTGFFIEAEEALFTGTVIDSFRNPDYSNFKAVRLDGVGDEVSDSVAFDYDVPAGEATVRARTELNNFDGEFRTLLDGQKLRDTVFSGISASLDWRLGFGSTAPRLEEGAHSFTIEMITHNGGSVDIDCISFRDDRFSYFEDNSVDTQFFTLSGPEEFPSGEQVEFDPATTSFHITDASVDVTESVGETINQVAVSGDGGNSFNTASGNSGSFAVPETTRSVIGRLELGRYSDDQSASPTDGDAGHAVDVFELAVDGNDLTVIDDLELTRNDFENLKRLHEYGNYRFVIKHTDGGIDLQEIESFQEGDQTRPKIDGFDDPANQSAEASARRYYNAIFLQGSRVNGTRPTAEVSDSQAVANDGREISPGVLRDPTITTEAGAAFRARSLLASASDNDSIEGSVTVPPVSTDPGFSRPIDFGDGEQLKTVERVTLSESAGTAQAEFEFSVVDDIAQQISELRSNARDIGDRV